MHTDRRSGLHSLGVEGGEHWVWMLPPGYPNPRYPFPLPLDTLLLERTCNQRHLPTYPFGKDLVLGITYCPPWTEWQMRVKTLPSFAVGRDGFTQDEYYTVADPRGRGTHAPPPRSQILSISVFGKIWQNCMLAPPPRGVGAPSSGKSYLPINLFTGIAFVKKNARQIRST